MYEIYEKKIESAFAGEGLETLIVKNNVVLAHCRGWDNPYVKDNWNHLAQPLVGKPISKRGKGWRKLMGFALENAQPWARDTLGL